MRPTVVDPLECQVGGIEGPFAIELHGLRVWKLVCKTGATRPRRQKRRRLESHHRSGKEAQGASVHLEPLQNVGRVKEPHHGHPAKRNMGEFRLIDQSVRAQCFLQPTWNGLDLPCGDVHRINIVAINERVELCRGRRSFVSSRWHQRQLLAFLELLQVQNGLGV